MSALPPSLPPFFSPSLPLSLLLSPLYLLIPRHVCSSPHLSLPPLFSFIDSSSDPNHLRVASHAQACAALFNSTWMMHTQTPAQVQDAFMGWARGSIVEAMVLDVCQKMRQG